MSDSVRPHRQQPTRLPHPWDSPGENTGVGCHFLLQCMKVKSESEVAQSCQTLSDPMDCSLPGSSVHGFFKAKVLEWGAIAFCDTKGVFQLRKRTTAPQAQPSTEMHCAMSGSPSCLKQYFVKKFRVSIFLLEENLQPGRTIPGPSEVTPCSPITQNLAKFSLGLGVGGQVGKHCRWAVLFMVFNVTNL